MMVVIYFYDRNHLHAVSLLALIEVESEHKNTTSAEVAPTPVRCIPLTFPGHITRGMQVAVEVVVGTYPPD